MKKVLSLLSVVVLSVSLLTLGACSSDKETLNVYTWADNFDPEVVKQFEKEFDVKVNMAVYGSNEEMLAKLQAGGSNYDLIQPSDYMVQTMIKLDMLEKINKENIPNIKNLDTSFDKPPYDPTGEYSVIYTTGVTGIAYNKKYIKEVPDSWEDLWTINSKGRLVLLNDVREVLGMGLIKNGYSNSSTNDAEIKKSYEDIKKLMPNLLAFDTDNIKQKLIAEEAYIGTLWNGDASYVFNENPDIGYVVPKEGGTIWADTFAVPKGAKNKELAEKFMDYILDPKVSAQNYEYVEYMNPNTAAKEFHSKEYLENPMLNLSSEDLAKTEWLMDVGDKIKLYDQYWTELKAGK